MKLSDKQKSIILDLICDKKQLYKTHGLKIDGEYKLELDKLEEKMSEPKQNFEKAMYESMCEHSEREDW